MYKRYVRNLQEQYGLNEVIKGVDGYYILFGVNNYYFGKTYQDLYMDILRKKY